MPEAWCFELESPVGTLYVIVSSEGVRYLDFAKSNTQNFMAETPPPMVQFHLGQLKRELQEYFTGQRRQFDVALDIQGTVFQNQVWQELKKIPFGQTISYKELAQRVGKPKAQRAVGAANGKNPVAVLIPCHRVIAANGKIGGYAGGVDMKIKLLNLEKNSPRV